MGKSALVTGAFGFVGRHVARKLASDGWIVTGLGHGSWTREESHKWGVDEWHVEDVTLEALITYGGKPDIIIHCAGSGSVAFSVSHPNIDFKRTVETMLAVLDFCRVCAPKARIIYPSSAGVYGVVRNLPILESAPLFPASPYGVHKRIAEVLCESYAQNFGLAVAIVRLFSVYGVGLRKQLLWDASQKIMFGQSDFFGTGEEIRDWLHVEDAANLLIAAASHASTNCPIVNGGGGKGVTVREILAQLFNYFSRVDSPNFSGVARSGDPPGYVADISLVNQWNWQAKINLSCGLREYVDWIKEGAP